MEWILPFVLGWWGTHWWPGIEVDAPKPGGGDPWWGLIVGVAGGVSAIILGQFIGASDPMAGVVIAIAAGAVGAHIVRAVVRGVAGNKAR